MISLHGSKWAPAASRARELDNKTWPVEQRHALTCQEEYDRFSKLLLRLRWRAHHLLTSQQQVLAHNDPEVKIEWFFTDTQSEAEMMFKVDFFEFYILLERAIVHLLGVFAVVISGSASFDAELEDRAGHFSNSQSLLGDQKVFNRATHSFHHNVLQALDSKTNPFHEVLGTGTVREYLSIAKEFRNRWKDVEEHPSSSSSPDRSLGRQRRYEQLLRELKLDDMLKCILIALDNAKSIAEAECTKLSLMNPTTAPGSRTRQTAQDMPWESMPDAMDWD